MTIMIPLLRRKLLHDLFSTGWHFRTWWWRILALEIIRHLDEARIVRPCCSYVHVWLHWKETDLGHGNPLHAFVLVDMLNNSLVHQENVRTSRYVGMNSHRKDELVWQSWL